MKFKTIKLSDVSDAGMYGVAESAVDYDEKLPTYLRITDINDDGTLNQAGLKSVAPQDDRYYLRDNEIVFARTGNSVGKSYYYDERDGNFIFAGFLIKFALHETDEFYPRYLKYYTTTSEYWGWVHGVSNGSTRGNINAKMFADMPISLPPKSVQIELVAVLDLLESKIRINRELNDNLLDLGITYTEEMLVKNDYPVSTIKSMNLTVSDHVANGSFKALKDNVEIVEDGGYALFLRNTDLKADLNGDRRFVTKSSYEFLKKSRLFGGEVIISNVGDVGSVYHVPYLDVPMVAGNNVVFLQSEESWLTDYLYFYFKSRIGQHDIDSITSGSAQQKFNKTDFRALEIPVILEHDVTILTKLIDNLNSNTQEIRTLMDTRDTLLKKLLN